jgi:hypothetical protein
VQVVSPSFAFGLFMFMAVGLMLLRESGRYAGYANSDVQYSIEVVKGRWLGKKRISRMVNALYYAGILLFAVATLYFLTAASTTADVFDYLLELVVAVSLMVAYLALSHNVGEREVYRDNH